MEGIVYKVQSYQENSKLLFVYTCEGKITLISKGSLTQNSNLRIVSQYLTLISFEESNKKMYSLRNAELLNDFSKIKEDYQLTKNAAVILEVLDKLIYENNNHLKIYEEALGALNGDLNYTYLSFLIRILFYLGYAPNIKGDGKKIKGMNAQNGGIVYIDALESADLNYDETLCFLRLCSREYADFEITEETKGRLIYFITKYYQYHLQITLKTLQ